jgi:predicted enzyme related to lactoylglutathione lyase
MRLRAPWHDLLTPDVALSRKFYESLRPDWTLESWDLGGMGRCDRIHVDGRPVGHIVQREGTSEWLPYLCCGDLSEACNRIEAVGGQLLVEPVEAPGFGLFSVAGDPNGAVFAAFEPESGFSAEPAGFGADVLIAPDSEKARSFYSHVFGETPDVVLMPGQRSRWVPAFGAPEGNRNFMTDPAGALFVLVEG